MTVTYRDIVLRMKDYLGGNSKAATEREIRSAILDAYRDISDTYRWRRLHKVLILTTSAQYTTGTVSFDLTGGSEERLWTLSGGTWPAWADRGTILIGVNAWPVQRRLSDTTLQSPASVSPAADIAATSFIFFQREYLLPEDFMAAGDAVPESAFSSLPRSLQTISWLHRQSPATGVPYWYSLQADRHLPGRSALVLEPPPSNAATFGFVYRRRPRKLKYSGFATRDSGGTITLAGTTITGSGTSFAADMEGSVIRLSGNSIDHPDDDTGDNPYSFEGIISQVSDSETLTVFVNPDSVALSNVKYNISDPIDLRDTLLNAFLRGCEMHCEITRNRDDSGKNMSVGLYEAALDKAKGADGFSFENFSLMDGSNRYGRDPSWERGVLTP